MKNITLITFLLATLFTAGPGTALADTVNIDLDSLCPTAGDLCPIPAEGVVLHDIIKLASPDGAYIYNFSDTPLDASVALLGSRTAIFSFDTSQARVSEISFSGSPDGGTLTYTATQNSNLPITVAENADFDASISAATGDMFTSLTLVSTSPDGMSPEPFARDFVITYTPIPVPPAVWLMASGLIGLVGIARRKRTG
jgi:hypothetical protein